MALQINIDNGGTLTDICIINGDSIKKTKVLTTPYDLSKCFFEGLQKASNVYYGQEDVKRLLEEVDLIRYSTTQGTNAICERKGPKLGLILTDSEKDLPKLLKDHDPDLFEALISNRIVYLDSNVIMSEEADVEVVKAINKLTAEGASRLIVSFDGPGFREIEDRFKKVALRKFPRHLLGAVPVLFASDLTTDKNVERRCWTAIINSFLHPSMEAFLYNAENRLREYRMKNPLLIFRNDGDASRVAKTIAIKTYSSGPRGGMEGVKAFSKLYGFTDSVSIDVGGTTTDIGQYLNGEVAESRHGHVEGISVSFPLCEIMSAGAGGSSIFRFKNDAITIGPDSVGAAPGPACFGRGGKEATITDASLLSGLLDPASYFGGGMGLDAERAAVAVQNSIATPMGCSIDEAVRAMENAYEQKIAEELNLVTKLSSETVLLAFGGAGPMNACGVAEKAGLKTVAIPHMAAVFSAFGIGSCDISQRYVVSMEGHTTEELQEKYETLKVKASRDMFAEGYDNGSYQIEANLVATFADGRVLDKPLGADFTLPPAFHEAQHIELDLRAVKNLRNEQIVQSNYSAKTAAKSSDTRNVLTAKKGRMDVPVYRLGDMQPGDTAYGPAILEEDFFTCRVLEDWRFIITENGDVILNKEDK